MVTWADSTACTTGPQLLYQAIGAGNLRPYVQGMSEAGQRLHVAVLSQDRRERGKSGRPQTSRSVSSNSWVS